MTPLMPNKGTPENSLNLTHWDSKPPPFVLEAKDISYNQSKILKENPNIIDLKWISKKKIYRQIELNRRNLL
jgi:hypothetical protein